MGPYCLVHQVYDFQTAHGCSLGHGKQSAAKGLIVHLQYGIVRLPEIGHEQHTYAICIQPVTNWKVPYDLVQQVYESQNAYGCSPGHGKQSAAIGIFVQLL